MGKRLKFILGALLLFTISMFTNCGRAPWSIPDRGLTSEDSTTIAQQVDAIVNPQFYTVEDFMLFRNRTSEGYSIDSVFRSIPVTTLYNVASVVLKKNGVIDKKSIVKEYRANHSVYNNLPTKEESTQDNTSATTVDLSSTDLGSREEKDIISTSYEYRTDTIDGTLVKVQIKKEEKYVK